MQAAYFKFKSYKKGVAGWMNVNRGEKNSSLVLAVALSLGCIVFPNGAGFASEKSDNIVVGAGEILETESTAQYPGLSYPMYHSVSIGSGGIWRPVDSEPLAGAVYLNGDLEIHKGGMIDLGWATGGYSGANSKMSLSVGSGTVTLHDGAVIRMNYHGGGGLSDSLMFYNTSNVQNTNIVLPDGETNIGFQLGYISKHANGTDIDWSENPTYISEKLDESVPVVTFYKGAGYYAPLDVPEGLTVTAQGSYMDSPLLKYWVEPELKFVENPTGLNSEYKGWYLSGFTAENTGVSESVMAAADNHRAVLNMWRLDDSFLFKRNGDLRMSRFGEQDDGHKRSEGVWANVYRGKYKYDSSYGRSINQNYKGVQVGFDKEHEGDFYNGTLYRGVYLGLSDADADFYSGKGELKSNSIGIYNSWIGNKGHFLDVGLRFARMENEYSYVDSAGLNKNNDYKTWAWGVSSQYGIRKELNNGLYYEPQAGLSYGRMTAADYTMVNGVRFHQENQDFLTGRVGILVGKRFNNNEGSDNIYAKAMLNHDFIGASDAAAAYGSGKLQVDPVGDKDTWVDLTIGANKKFSETGSGYIELTKTVGGEVRSDWQIAGGLNWSWGSAPRNRAAVEKKAAAAVPELEAVTEKTAESIQKPQAAVKQREMSAISKEQAPAAETRLYEAAADAEPTSVKAETGTGRVVTAAEAGSEDIGAFELGPVTVEGKRPDWEKSLSPGTVSVVYPDDYKGEMKKLPEMLQNVAGVFVQKLQGTGHYAVARVRGSSSAQVNVYVDGVLMNSAAETGVDLSTIPVENVARIEVYRGYIPARFSGAAIGGVINIVTKKPGEAGGSASYGMRSFDGYTGNIEVTAPLGKGSLMVAANRDQARGEFKYRKYWLDSSNKNQYTQGSAYRQNNDYQHTDAMIKWQDENWLFKLSHVDKKDGIPASGTAQADVGWTDMKGEWFRGSAKTIENKNTDILLGRRQESGNLEWGWQVNYGKHEKTSRFNRTISQYTPAGVNSYYDHDIYGAKIDGSWKMGDSHLVEFLLDASKEKMHTDGNYHGRPEYSEGKGFPREFLHEYDTKNYYFQIQDTISLDHKKSLLFTPLWRAQKMEMTAFEMPGEDDWKYSYGLGLKKLLNENTTLRASYGTYWRSPNFYEIFGDGGAYVIPRPTSNVTGSNITWENGDQYEIGIDWNGRALGADSSLSLTYFNRHVENLSSYVIAANGEMYYLNAGIGKIDGVEMETNWRWKNWEFSQTATWNNSHITKSIDTYGREFTPDQKFTGIPEWETNSRLTYYCGDKKTSIFAEYHYVSDIDYNVVAPTSTPQYYNSLGIANMGVKYNPNKNWKFTAGINDIFNKGPEQTTLRISDNKEFTIPYPQQGRTYYMSMQYLF